ncbi:hypothetical protein HK405_010039, partial [Cladochytrium tenue]
MALLLILVAAIMGLDAGAKREIEAAKFTKLRAASGAIMLSILLDMYCYFSLLEYLANATWARWYGYSPFPFLMATCFGLLHPRNFKASFEFLDRPELAERAKKYEKRLALFNILFVVVVFGFTLYRMVITMSVQFNGVRTLVQMNGTYKYVNEVDQASITANTLYSLLNCDYDDCTAYSANLFTCNPSPTIIDPTAAANASSLVCSLRHPQLNTYFGVWGSFILVALLFLLLAAVNNTVLWAFAAGVFVLLFVVEWCVVLGRDAHSPGIDASLIWCPTSFVTECLYLDFGTVYPYSLDQSATWFRTLGPLSVTFDLTAALTQLDSQSALDSEVAHIATVFEVKESEDTWLQLDEALARLNAIVRGSHHLPGVVPAVKRLKLAILVALSTERTRLARTGMALVEMMAAALGDRFEPLVDITVPPLLRLCSRANKVFVSCANATLKAVVEAAGVPSIIPLLHESLQSNSKSLRASAADCLVAVLEANNPSRIEAFADAVEAAIKLAVVDAAPEVRTLGRSAFELFKDRFPHRVDRLLVGIPEVTLKYLKVAPVSTRRPIAHAQNQQSQKGAHLSKERRDPVVANPPEPAANDDQRSGFGRMKLNALGETTTVPPAVFEVPQLGSAMRAPRPIQPAGIQPVAGGSNLTTPMPSALFAG